METKSSTKEINAEFLKTLSQTNKTLAILYQDSKLNKEEVAQRLCPLVFSVPFVSSVSFNKDIKDNKENKDEGTDSYETILENVKKILQRLEDANLIIADRSIRPFIYSITEKGKAKVITELNHFEEGRETSNLEAEVKDTEAIIQSFKEYIGKSNSPIIDISKLSQFNSKLSDLLIDDFECNKAAVEIALERLDLDPNKLTIINLPKSDNYNINQLGSAQIDNLVTITCEIRSRDISKIKIQSAKFECPSCGNILPVKMFEDFTPPTRCGCGRKGKFIMQKANIEDCLRFTVADLPDNLIPADAIEELDCIVMGKHHNIGQLKETDKVKVTGVLKYKDNIKSRTDAERTKQLIVYGIDKLDEKFTDVIITDDDNKLIQQIAQSPFEWIRTQIFPDLHDVDLPIKANALALAGNINVGFFGKPGRGKSEIPLRFSKLALRGAFAACQAGSSTAAGLIGAATKNEHTGRYTLDNGQLLRMHPGGMQVLDEVNRDADGTIQAAVLGIMSQKILAVSKANIHFNRPCNIKVIITANSLDQYNKYKKLHDIFHIISPLWDRLDLKIFFNNVLDYSNTELVKKLLQKKFCKLDEDKVILFKKYQLQIQQIKPILTDNDFSKISVCIADIFPQMGINNSYRRLNLLSELLQAHAKLHLRSYLTDADYRSITDFVLAVANQERLFKDELENND